ncbi:hypothetical protein A0257_06435 [Hymenobacter psoromatis]|nr:hypothetical protein A0257_06435 [Hymenobacter psoromatis]
MPRSLLVLLLLLNYLLVVCASVAPQAGIAAARPFDYVHSPDCQLKNAWRGGVCFDDCNGVQYHVHKGHKPLPLQQLLTTLKGLDLHCLPLVAAVAALPVGWRAARPLAAAMAAVPLGVRGRIEAPPRRG